MLIGITSDHRGFELKKELIKYLEDKEYKVKDLGCFTSSSCDYSTYGIELGEEVAQGKLTLGIAICGTGIGMSIACNKVKGILCAKVDNEEEARLAKVHNDANIIAMSSLVGFEKAKEIVDIFLTTDFSNEERHLRRINRIREYENRS